MKLALCLSGGGTYGIRQCGMLKYLHEQNIMPDIIFGTSVGAINATLFAQGDYEKLEEMWLTVKQSDIMKFHWNPLNWNKYDSLFSSEPLGRLLSRLVDVSRLQAHIAIKTTDTKNNASLMFQPAKESGNAYAIFSILSSAAIPVIFPAQGIDIKFMDGGITDNFGLEDARRMHYDQIILFACNKPRPYIGGLLEAFETLFILPEWSQLALERARCHSACKQSEFHGINPHQTKIQKYLEVIPEAADWGLLDFKFGGRDRKQLIAEGYELAKSIIQPTLLQ